MTEPMRVVPFADRDSAPWWAALAEHRLVQQRCSDCGRWRWPPRAICGACGALAWSWEPIAETGEVVSWITTHHGFLPGFDAPYHTVFVRLDLSADTTQDDLVMPGSWHSATTPAIGMAVRARFDDIDSVINHDNDDDRVSLVGWAPVEGS